MDGRAPAREAGNAMLLIAVELDDIAKDLGSARARAAGPVHKVERAPPDGAARSVRRMLFRG